MTTLTKPTEFLFIDANVADKQTLISSTAANVKVIELSDKTAALTQIAAELKGVKNLDAIHIISHGSEGELDFANGKLNSANLSTYKSQLQKIGASLSKDGDILLYGCDVAKGDDGSAFINSLAKLTKADIAASTDFTGAASWGGDWVLENHTGAIEAQTFQAENWKDILTSVGTTEAKLLEFPNPTTESVSSPISFSADAKLITTGYTNATYSSSDNKIHIPVTPGQASIGFGGYVPGEFTGPGALYLYAVNVTDTNGNPLLSEEFDSWTGTLPLLPDNNGETKATFTGDNARVWSVFHNAPAGDMMSMPPGGLYTGNGQPFTQYGSTDKGIVYPMDGAGPFSVLVSTNLTIPSGVNEILVDLKWGYSMDVMFGDPRTFSIGFQNQVVDTKNLFSFSAPAVDTTPPVFSPTTSTPADNAITIAIANNITLKFNEAIDGTASDLTKVYLKDVATDTTVPAAISIVSGDVVINPNANLAGGTNYYVTWDAAALKDASGNAVIAVSDETTFNFGTETPPNAAPTITGQAAVSGGSTIDINDFTVGDVDNPASLKVHIKANSGVLTLTTTTDITGYTVPASEITFSGSITALNTALNSLGYQANQGFSGTDALIVEVSDDNGTTWQPYNLPSAIPANTYFNSANGHYYQYVTTPSTWLAAQTTATGSTLYGASGYLATITSQNESDFLAQHVGNSWFGAKYDSSSQTWKWDAGPEAGQTLIYDRWHSGEPNGGGSQYAYLYNRIRTSPADGLNGDWYDEGDGPANYIVEYGGVNNILPTAPVLVVTVSPIIVTTSNDDDAVGASLAADIADGGLSLREALHWVADNGTVGFDAGLDGQTITLATDVEVKAGVTFDADAVGTLTIAGSTLNLIGALNVTNGATDNLTISSNLTTGDGSLVKQGVGNLTLSGTNSGDNAFDGIMTISGGSLTISSDANLGNGYVQIGETGATVNEETRSILKITGSGEQNFDNVIMVGASEGEVSIDDGLIVMLNGKLDEPDLGAGEAGHDLIKTGLGTLILASADDELGLSGDIFVN